MLDHTCFVDINTFFYFYLDKLEGITLNIKKLALFKTRLFMSI